MATGVPLRVQISADLADIKQGLAVLRGDLAKVKKDAASAAPDTTAWARGLGQVRTAVVQLAAAYASLRTVRAYLDLADQAANLSARLKLATDSQEGFNKAYAETFKIAQRTSASWESVVDLYARLATTTGMAQDQILALTETISQSFQVSGASQQDTANGLRQLTQALAGGVLRAEEFNSIIETAPRLVQALADHYGVAFGEVRKRVNEGKVSTQDFVAALAASQADIREEFDQLPLTVSRAVQQVKNSLIKLVGDTEQGTGATRDLAQAISDLAKTLASDETKRGLGVVVDFLTAVIRLAGPALRVVDAIGQQWENIGEGVTYYVAALKQGLAALKDFDVQGLFAARDLARQGFRTATRWGAPGGDQEGPAAEGGGALDPSGEGGGNGEDAQKQIAASNALLRDSIKRALSELDRLYAGHEVGLREYFATRQQLQEQAIDAEIQQARAELAVTKDLAARRRLEEQIIILQRDRAEVGEAAARDEAKALDDLNKQLADVHTQLLELDGNTAAAARARFETQYQDLLIRLEKASDETGKAIVRNLIDRLVDKAVFDQIRSRASEATGLLSSQEASISAQMDAGTLGYTEGERRLRELRLQQREVLIQLKHDTIAYLQTLSPESAEYRTALASLHQLDADIANITASLQEFRQGAQDSGYNALVGFFENLKEGAMSAGDAFRQLVSDFASGIYSMLAQITAKRLVSAISNLFSGAKGSAASVGEGAQELSKAATTTGLAGGAIVLGANALSRSAKELQSAATTLLIANSVSSFGAAHGGGIAGAPRMMRHNISPLVFGAAPRYHTGGIAGLASDEVPAILRRGETIRTKEQEAALGRNMDAARQGTSEKPATPIIVFGEDQLADALGGRAGEKVVIHHVKNNRNLLGDDG